MDRPDVVSRGVSESAVLDAVLHPSDITGDRFADLLAAVHSIQLIREDTPLRLRILCHALHAELHQRDPGGDTWQKVAELITLHGHRISKATVWRWAHPAGLEVEA